MTPEVLLTKLDLLKSDRVQLVESLKTAIKSAFVDKFIEGYERPCTEHDFSGNKANRESHIKTLKVIFHQLADFFIGSIEGVAGNSPEMDNELLALILVLCGENISCQQWNNKSIVMHCKDLLSDTLKIFSCKDVSNLISREHKIHIIKDILQILRPNLLTNTWKNYPASILCYKWILEHIKQPELSNHLPMLLPTSLLLVDDFVNENKIIGIQCLNHIVQNVTIAELQFCGHGDVIYNALLPLLRIREAELINVTVPCLVHLTTKLEMDFGKKNLTKWSKFDDILEIYLENMELESLVDLRNAYISNLEALIHATKFGIVRWCQRLLRIFKEYLEIAGKHNDSKTTNYCLKAIESFIELSQSVTQIYAKDLIYILLVVFVSEKDGPEELENSEITKRCIKKIIESTSKSDIEKLKIDLKKSFSSGETFTEFYKKVCEVLELLTISK